MTYLLLWSHFDRVASLSLRKVFCGPSCQTAGRILAKVFPLERWACQRPEFLLVLQQLMQPPWLHHRSRIERSNSLFVSNEAWTIAFRSSVSSCLLQSSSRCLARHEDVAWQASISCNLISSFWTKHSCPICKSSSNSKSFRLLWPSHRSSSQIWSFWWPQFFLWIAHALLDSFGSDSHCQS